MKHHPRCLRYKLLSQPFQSKYQGRKSCCLLMIVLLLIYCPRSVRHITVTSVWLKYKSQFIVAHHYLSKVQYMYPGTWHPRCLWHLPHFLASKHLFLLVWSWKVLFLKNHLWFDRLKMNNHFSRVAGVVVISLITARTPIPSLKEKKTWVRRTGVKKLARLRPGW